MQAGYVASHQRLAFWQGSTAYDVSHNDTAFPITRFKNCLHEVIHQVF
jgi:hypothetical protein